MPGKKKVEEAHRPLFGRPGNTLKMGIVGVPNVGKSSTFNLLAELSVPAENYPFCTIDPNVARVAVPDPRYDTLCRMWRPASMVSAFLSITDIAGLVPGASEGAGLGNAFLSHINAVDGIFQVVRAFDDTDVVHTEGEVNPVRDLDIIHHELIAKDLTACSARIEEVERVVKRTNDKQAKVMFALLSKVQECLQAERMVKDAEWSTQEIELLNNELFLTSKPIIYLVNLSQDDYIRKKNRWLVKIQQWVNEHGGGSILPYSITMEQNLKAMSQEEREAFLKANSTRSMVPKIIESGYRCLELIHYFTCGEDEVKCWTIRRGTKAPQAAGVIHTDFERGFICAEVTKYDDWVALGSDAAVKAEGKMRQCGKEYVVEDGDIIYFRFNVSHSKGK